MLKIATLALVLLGLASPSFAKNTTAAPPKAECTAPTAFPSSVKIEGADLVKFKQIASLPEQVDLVLLLKNTPIVVLFVKSCVVGYGVIGPVAAKPESETL